MKRLNKISNIYILPFVLVAFIFLFLCFFTINLIKDYHYEHQHEDSIKIAKYYSKNLTKATEAYEIVNELLVDKLVVALRATAMSPDIYDNHHLQELATNLEVDEIYIYDYTGIIVYTNEKYLGWQALPNHPVHNFMISDLDILVEEIRKDSESDLYYKYGYKKLDDGYFIQIGIISDTIQNFLGHFEFAKIFSEIIDYGVETDISLIDNNFEIIGSTNNNLIGTHITKEKIKTAIINDDDIGIVEERYGGRDYVVYTPVYLNNEKIGTIAVSQSLAKTDKSIMTFATLAMSCLVVTFILIVSMLYISYTKREGLFSLVYYDQVTKLPNDNYLKEFLRYELKKTNTKALLLIKCRNYDLINLIYGSEYSDKLLIETSNILSQHTNDKIFRFSDDVFVLYVSKYDETNDIKNHVLNILKLFYKPILVCDNYQFIDLSVGIFEITSDYHHEDQVIKKASIVLDYISKNEHIQYAFFNDKMEEQIRREEKIEKILYDVIEGKNNNFYLEFQPLIDVKKDSVTCFEALARLYDEQLGFISPVEFIRIAERKHLINHLGKIILKKACDFIRKVKEKYRKNVRVAINISGLQLLNDDFENNLLRIINEEGINGNDLDIEVTESNLVKNYEQVNGKLKKLQDRGIRISIDDFGTGYSSFARLRDMNVDIIKLDKLFVDRIMSLQDKELILIDLISLIHKLGLKVVAEGVEYELQNQYLINIGCDIIQGYYYSKPLKEKDALDFLGV